VGATGWSACAQPRRSDCDGSARVGAQLGSAGVSAGASRPGDLGLSIVRAACARRASARVGRRPRRRRAGRASAASSADLGRTAAAATFGPAAGAARTAGTTGRGAQLGRARPCQAGVERAPARDAAASCAACADLGIAPGRVRGAPGARGRRLESAPAAIVGRRAAGCGKARSGFDRLGGPPCKRSARGSAGALLERAGRPFFLGRPQDRGACGPTRAVLGRPFRLAGCSAGLVSAGPR
jgi:hypothetical protein